MKIKMMERLNNPGWALGLIFFLVLLAFSNVWGNHFVLEDYGLVADWPLIHDLRNLPRFFVGYIPAEGQPAVYTPFNTVWRAVLHLLIRENPLGYHLVTLLIHLAGIFFVYRLTRVLTGNGRIAFLTGLLFGLHPLQVESVTWITAGIDNLRNGLFAGGFLLLCRLFAGPVRLAAYVGSIVLSGLAVFTNEAALVIPLLWTGYDIFFPPQPGGGWRARGRRLAPFYGLAAGYLFLKWLALGAVVARSVAGGWSALALAGKVWARGLSPAGLALSAAGESCDLAGGLSPGFDLFASGPAGLAALGGPYVLPSFLIVVAVIAIARWLRRRQPLAAFAFLWIVLCLLSTVNDLPAGLFSPGRYLYPAVWGTALLLSMALVQWRADPGRPLGLGRRVIVGLLVVLCAARVWGINRDWQDNVTLYRSAVRRAPNSAALRQELGMLYLRQDDPDQALEQLERARALRPEDPQIFFILERAYSSLGRYEEAEAALKTAVRLDPKFAEAYFNLAGLYLTQGQLEPAADQLVTAVELYQDQGRILEAGALIESIKQYAAIMAYQRQQAEADASAGTEATAP